MFQASRFKFQDNGQAALSLVFLIGGVLVLIGVTLSFVVISFLNATYGFQAANRALGVATAGVEDALLQLARNKDFSVPSGYSMPLGAASAAVKVTQGAPAAGLATILSQAVVGSHERKLQVVVSVSAATGRVHVVSWQEVPL